jgi:hypothetical protein
MRKPDGIGRLGRPSSIPGLQIGSSVRRAADIGVVPLCGLAFIWAAQGVLGQAKPEYGENPSFDPSAHATNARG